MPMGHSFRMECPSSTPIASKARPTLARSCLSLSDSLLLIVLRLPADPLLPLVFLFSPPFSAESVTTAPPVFSSASAMILSFWFLVRSRGNRSQITSIATGNRAVGLQSPNVTENIRSHMTLLETIVGHKPAGWNRGNRSAIITPATEVLS